MRQPTYIEQLRGIRERALNDIPGSSKFSELCVILEDEEFVFFMRNRWYHLVQINPDNTLYAYCKEGDEMCHIKNEVLPTPVACQIADFIHSIVEWKKTRYQYKKGRGRCHTERYQDKQMKEIKK